MRPEPYDDRPSGTPEFYASLPTKAMAAGCIFTDELGQVLLLKPIYKEPWDLPGGVVEAGESPYAACCREIREELGVDLRPERLAAVDYRQAVAGVRADALRIIFSAAPVSDHDVQRITLNPNEHSEWRFVAVEDLDAFMIPAAARRIRACLSEHAYLEEGRPVMTRRMTRDGDDG